MTRFGNLIALSTQDEAPAASGKLSSVVEKALNKHREEQEAAAGDEILQVLRLVEDNKQTHRQSIKRLRSQMKTATDALDNLDRASAYGQETGNFLPLLATLGAVNCYGASMEPAEFEKASKVPAEWKPTK